MFYVVVIRNTVTLVYYGLTFYVPSLGTNPYLSLIFSGLVEVSIFSINKAQLYTNLHKST